jgi:hypothetical protein
MMSRRILVFLFVGAVSLPAAVTICCALAWALSAMADTAGAVALNRVAFSLGVLWIVDLVAMLIYLAWQQLILTEEGDNSHE